MKSPLLSLAVAILCSVASNAADTLTAQTFKHTISREVGYRYLLHLPPEHGADAARLWPLIVFLHEGLGSLSMWRDYPAQLCDAVGWRGLVYSRPGYGRSTPRAAPPSAASAAPAAADAAAPTGNSDTRITPTAGDRRQRGPSYGDLVGSKGGNTALLLAVRDGQTAAVNALLMAGAKVNHASAGDSTTPLLMATINGRFDLAKTLLDRGGDPKLASAANATPLYAVINVVWAPKAAYPQPVAQYQSTVSYLELMEALIKAGADVNVRLTKHLWYMSYNFDQLSVSTAGATPFWRAAYGTDLEAMKLLLKYGADPSVATIKPAGRLPGSEELDADVAAGKDPSGLPPVPDNGPGVLAIHTASGAGYGEGFAANAHRHAPDAWVPTVTFLVEELKADVNARDFKGYTPLHHAAARGDNALIKYLVSKGADPMAVARTGQTTVDMANGAVQRIPPFLDTIELLEKMGAKNNHKCKSC